MNKSKATRKENINFLKRLEKGLCSISDVPKTEWNSFEYAKGIYKNDRIVLSESEFVRYMQEHPRVAICVFCYKGDLPPDTGNDDVVDFSDL